MTAIKLRAKPIRKPKQEDNVKFIKRIMTESTNSPLMQGFIIDAITKQANAVVKAGPVKLAEQMAGNGSAGWFSPQAWYNVAKELKEELDLKYGSNDAT